MKISFSLQHNKAEWSAMHSSYMIIISCRPVIHFGDYVDVIFAFENELKEKYLTHSVLIYISMIVNEFSFQITKAEYATLYSSSYIIIQCTIVIYSRACCIKALE